MAEWTKLQQAKSIWGLFSASVHNMKWAATPEQMVVRMEICEACPNLKIGERRGQPFWHCSICGCAYKRKITKFNSSCPIGKWLFLGSLAAEAFLREVLL